MPGDPHMITITTVAVINDVRIAMISSSLPHDRPLQLTQVNMIHITANRPASKLHERDHHRMKAPHCNAQNTGDYQSGDL